MSAVGNASVVCWLIWILAKRLTSFANETIDAIISRVQEVNVQSA